MNCRSKNVIYLVSCLKYPVQGVGQAENFQARVFNYIPISLKENERVGLLSILWKQVGIW